MRTAAILAAACAAACSHATLPGTNIPDNDQTRAVLDVFGRYREAIQARDSAALLALAAPSYYDAGDPSHSIGPTDRASLETKLQTDFKKVNGLKLETTIRDIQVKGDEANLDYFEILRYAVATPTGERWKSESDDSRMKFVKIAGEWKISSGL
jgi:hypothetical protein